MTKIEKLEKIARRVSESVASKLHLFTKKKSYARIVYRAGGTCAVLDGGEGEIVIPMTSREADILVLRNLARDARLG